MIWPKLEEGAQLFYAALKKMEFSARNYREMLDLYNKEAAAAVGKSTSLDESKILRSVACRWLNSKPRSSSVAHNYERWTSFGGIKQKLTIGGIFPMTGTNYKAPELIPGT